MQILLHKYLNDESGQGIVEYALVVAGIAVFCLTALYLMHEKLASFFNSLPI